jgi:hypothetical protein
MELDKAKLQEVVEKIAYQQTAEDQADDLFNKMGILNKYVQEQLTLTDVSQQRELLKGFMQYVNCADTTSHIYGYLLEDYLKTL